MSSTLQKVIRRRSQQYRVCLVGEGIAQRRRQAVGASVEKWSWVS